MKYLLIVVTGVCVAAAAFADSCIVSGSTERSPSHSAVSSPADGNTLLAANGGVWFATSVDSINFLTLGFGFILR